MDIPNILGLAVCLFQGCHTCAQVIGNHLISDMPVDVRLVDWLLTEKWRREPSALWP